eukprot:11166031-Lingulodinium_polyedra.AAC.1
MYAAFAPLEPQERVLPSLVGGTAAQRLAAEQGHVACQRLLRPGQSTFDQHIAVVDEAQLKVVPLCSYIRGVE